MEQLAVLGTHVLVANIRVVAAYYLFAHRCAVRSFLLKIFSRAGRVSVQLGSSDDVAGTHRALAGTLCRVASTRRIVATTKIRIKAPKCFASRVRRTNEAVREGVST